MFEKNSILLFFRSVLFLLSKNFWREIFLTLQASTCNNGISQTFPTAEKRVAVAGHVRNELAAFCQELILKKPEKNSAESELEVNRQISQGLRCLAKYYSRTDSKYEVDLSGKDYI